MKNHLSSLPHPRGLTLVELLLVIVIIGILSSLSILTFVSFNSRQQLNVAASDLKAAINTAKARAQAQVKPNEGSCATGTMDGYRIRIQRGPNAPCSTASGTTGCYRIYPVCSGTAVIPSPEQTKHLPQNVQLDNSYTFTFRVLTGSVSEAAVGGTPVLLNNGSSSITLRVFRDGRITQQ